MEIGGVDLRMEWPESPYRQGLAEVLFRERWPDLRIEKDPKDKCLFLYRDANSKRAVARHGVTENLSHRIVTLYPDAEGIGFVVGEGSEYVVDLLKARRVHRQKQIESLWTSLRIFDWSLDFAMLDSFGQRLHLLRQDHYRYGGGYDACVPDVGTEAYEVFDAFVRITEQVVDAYVKSNSRLAYRIYKSTTGITAGRDANGALTATWARPFRMDTMTGRAEILEEIRQESLKL